MKIELSLTSNRWFESKRAWALYAFAVSSLLVLIQLACFTHCFQKYFGYSGEMTAINGDIDHLRNHMKVKKIKGLESSELKSQVDYLNGLSKGGTRSWSELLHRLEGCITSSVKLHSLEMLPDGTLVVEGLTASAAGLRSQLEKLDQEDYFGKVRLESQAEKVVNQVKYIFFKIEMRTRD